MPCSTNCQCYVEGNADRGTTASGTGTSGDPYEVYPDEDRMLGVRADDFASLPTLPVSEVGAIGCVAATGLCYHWEDYAGWQDVAPNWATRLFGDTTVPELPTTDQLDAFILHDDVLTGVRWHVYCDFTIQVDLLPSAAAIFVNVDLNDSGGTIGAGGPWTFTQTVGVDLDLSLTGRLSSFITVTGADTIGIAYNFFSTIGGPPAAVRLTKIKFGAITVNVANTTDNA